jgi:hypothetical protein
MAAGKPAILAGELGFVQLIEPATIEPFLHQGFWGVGNGARASGALADLVADVLDRSATDRQRLGDFGRNFVVDRFGISTSAEKLLDMYENAAAWTPPRRLVAAESIRVPMSVAWRKVRDRLPGRRNGVRALGTPSQLGDQYLSANAFLRQGVPE